MQPTATNVTKAENDMNMHGDLENKALGEYSLAAARAKIADKFVLANQTKEAMDCAGIGLPLSPAEPEVQSSIPPGEVHLFYALGNSWGNNPNWRQLLSIDENRKVLAWIRGKVYRIDTAGGDALLEDTQMSPNLLGITCNQKTGDVYGMTNWDLKLKDYLTAEAATHMESRMKKIVSETGFPFATSRGGPCVLKQAPDGARSVPFGMGIVESHDVCAPWQEQRHCPSGSEKRKFGQMYMDRLAEVSAGKDVDPNADISLNGFISRMIVVDPDTKDVYSTDWENNYFPSRWVVWKFDAATQRARVVAGHFNSFRLTGLSYGQISGFGQPATAAHLGTIYAIGLHPITKELHVVGYPGNLVRVDAAGNLQAVECARCKTVAISAITYHKREKQWIVMGGNNVFWQNGTTIVGRPKPPRSISSYEEDPGPWKPSERWINTGDGNMVLDEASNELYMVHNRPFPAIFVVNLSPA